jgi:AbiV family abortive infection protein
MAPTDAQRLLLGCQAVFENALELAEEAGLLLAHSHYPRAYFLSHIASEELGKVPFLLCAAEDFERGVAVDWKRLRRHLERHRAKLAALTHIDDVAAGGANRLVQGMAIVPLLDRSKNAALYAKVDATHIGKPIATDWTILSERITALLLERLSFVGEHGLADNSTYVDGITRSSDTRLARFVASLRSSGFDPASIQSK